MKAHGELYGEFPVSSSTGKTVTVRQDIKDRWGTREEMMLMEKTGPNGDRPVPRAIDHDRFLDHPARRREPTFEVGLRM